MRADEIHASIHFIGRPPQRIDRPNLAGTAHAKAHRADIGIAEGWRGTIVHRVGLAPGGLPGRVKIVDPSFFTWPARPVATAAATSRLTNKSFNLSYAGNDL